MRTMRLTLTGMIALMLSVGMSVPVVAQTEDAEVLTSPVAVSGTLECLGEAPADQATDASASAAPAGTVVNVHEWVASDPRLSGEVAYTGTWHIYGEPSEDSGTPAAADRAVYEIVNDGGKWLCEASRVVAPGDRAGSHTLLFNGEGEYEGLTAYLQVDWSQAPYAFSGVILPGEAPPYAEPQG